MSSAGTSMYSYFPDGRIASRVDDWAAAPANAAGSTAFSVGSTSNRVQGATGQVTRSYGYDAAGNTTSDGGRTFTYDDAGRMTTATAGGVTTSYSYNGLGERIKKTNAVGTTRFAYDEAGHLLGEYTAAGGLLAETVWLGDVPVAVLKPDGSGGILVYYVHTDHLRDPD